jgi:hypothetical protein
MRFKPLQTNNKLNTHYVKFKDNIVTYRRKTPNYTLRATLTITYIDGDNVLNKCLNFGDRMRNKFILCCSSAAKRMGAKACIFASDGGSGIITLSKPPCLHSSDFRGINSWYNVEVTAYQRIDLHEN